MPPYGVLGRLTASPAMTDNFRVPAGKSIADEVEVLREALDRLRLEIEELRASRRRILLRADTDRATIERELHDGVQQHLVALAVKLQLVGDAARNDRRAAGPLLEEIGRDVQEAIDEAARLAQRIHPPRLDAVSLRAALRSRALSAGVRASIELQLGRDFSPEQVESVYFCCVEVLGQVGAGARVDVTVRGENEMAVFDAVYDSAADVELERIRDRVDALDGHLVSRPEADERIRVSGSIPRSRRS